MKSALKSTKGEPIYAWAIEHDSHGLYWDTLIFLPANDKPETPGKWRRLPWLDSDHVKEEARLAMDERAHEQAG